MAAGLWDNIETGVRTGRSIYSLSGYMPLSNSPCFNTCLKGAICEMALVFYNKLKQAVVTNTLCCDTQSHIGSFSMFSGIFTASDKR